MSAFICDIRGCTLIHWLLYPQPFASSSRTNRTSRSVHRSRLEHQSTPAMSANAAISDRMAKPDAFGGICKASNDILDLLKQDSLAFDRGMAPSSLGVHPANRSSYGCHEVTFGTSKQTCVCIFQVCCFSHATAFAETESMGRGVCFSSLMCRRQPRVHTTYLVICTNTRLNRNRTQYTAWRTTFSCSVGTGPKFLAAFASLMMTRITSRSSTTRSWLRAQR